MLIPAEVGEAKQRLGALEGLVTAGEWERSAIVYAFTQPSIGGRPSDEKPAGASAGFSFKAFADLGIRGLRDRDTVRRYHNAWADAVAAGQAQPAAPGKRVAIPKQPFPATTEVARSVNRERREQLMQAGRKAGMGSGAKVADVAANPRAVGVAIKHDARTAATARKALEERDTAALPTAERKAVEAADGAVLLDDEDPADAAAIRRAEWENAKAMVGHITRAARELRAAAALSTEIAYRELGVTRSQFDRYLAQTELSISALKGWTEGSLDERLLSLLDQEGSAEE